MSKIYRKFVIFITNKNNKMSEFFKNNYILFWCISFAAFIILVFSETDSVMRPIGFALGMFVAIISLNRIIDLNK